MMRLNEDASKPHDCWFAACQTNWMVVVLVLKGSGLRNVSVVTRDLKNVANFKVKRSVSGTSELRWRHIRQLNYRKLQRSNGQKMSEDYLSFYLFYHDVVSINLID